MDDGSEDGSGELLLARARADPRLRVVRAPASRAGGRARRRARGGPRPAGGEDGRGRRGPGARLALQAGRLEQDPAVDVLGCRVALAPSPGTRRGGHARLRGVAERARRPRRDGARPVRRFAPRPPLGDHEDGHPGRLGGWRDFPSPRTTTCGCAASTRGCASPSSKRRSSSGATRPGASRARTRATRAGASSR